MDELTDSAGQSSTMTLSTKSIKSAVNSASQLARDIDDEEEEGNEQRQRQSALSVRFLDENLESVHHIEVPTREASVEEVLWKWDRLETTAKWDAERLRERTRLELRDLRNADMTPHYYDPAWD